MSLCNVLIMNLPAAADFVGNTLFLTSNQSIKLEVQLDLNHQTHPFKGVIFAKPGAIRNKNEATDIVWVQIIDFKGAKSYLI